MLFSGETFTIQKQCFDALFRTGSDKKTLKKTTQIVATY